MGRLIEVANSNGCPSSVLLHVGDVLLMHATGGRVAAGDMEMIGPLITAVVGIHGEVVTPLGAPNALMFRALRPGQAVIEVMTGSPWHGSGTITIRVVIDA